ncbi:MAG: universal stress protein [Alphaproteobacteria bacterium]|nr:universal stress protein [Alphaproteobacteria bacterium]
MSIKSILVAVNGTEASRPALHAAFVVARDCAAHLDVLHVRGDPRDAVPILGEGVSGTLIEEIMDVAEKESRERAIRARAMYDEFGKKFDIPVTEHAGAGRASVSWFEDTGREDEVVGRRARLADLVVLPRPTPESDVGATMTLNAALFDTGRPVLVVPPGYAGGTIGGKIAISWNGSTEAARAISGAMSLIARAKEVTVMTAVGETPAAPEAPEMLTYLGWHGVGASTHNLPSTSKIEGEVLFKDIARIGADLVVMGAYTRNRFRQMILGGVTRYALESAQVPLLMAH